MAAVVTKPIGVPRKMPRMTAEMGIQPLRYDRIAMTEPLKSPFPYPGGKADVAAEIWRRFGDVPNFVDAFCGSAAVLFARPHALDGKTETCNDADGLLCNALRAIAYAPEETAAWCDWPVSEADLTARHLWLKAQRDDLTSRLFADPEYCDPQAAGWWLWGIASWIGDGWCVADGPWINVGGRLVDRRTLPEGEQEEGIVRQMPVVGSPGEGGARLQGIHRYRAAPGVRRKMPKLDNESTPIQTLRQRDGVPRKMPKVTENGGADGVQALRQRDGVGKRIPKVGANGAGADSGHNGVQRKEFRESAPALLSYFDRLATRLRRVRLLCGDWRRAVKDSITVNHGLTGLLLDPPYPSAEHSMAYHGDNDIWWDVARWAVAHGDDPRLRICVCGYVSDATEAIFPPNWARVAWQARGGYSNQSKAGRGRANARREMLWFSPHCIDAATDYGPLFEAPS